MGAGAYFKDLTPWAAALLAREPWLTETFVCWARFDRMITPALRNLPQEEQRTLKARVTKAVGDAGSEARSKQKHTRPADVARVRPFLSQLKSEWDRPGLDIDKAGPRVVAKLRDHPSARAILGGTEIGDDLGYGRARLISLGEVQTLFVDLSEVAPRYIQYSDVDSSIMFEAIVDYYDQAARAGHAMLVWGISKSAA
jgi:hypothetical protein